MGEKSKHPNVIFFPDLGQTSPVNPTVVTEDCMVMPHCFPLLNGFLG